MVRSRLPTPTAVHARFVRRVRPLTTTKRAANRAAATLPADSERPSRDDGKPGGVGEGSRPTSGPSVIRQSRRPRSNKPSSGPSRNPSGQSPQTNASAEGDDGDERGIRKLRTKTDAPGTKTGQNRDAACTRPRRPARQDGVRVPPTSVEVTTTDVTTSETSSTTATTTTRPPRRRRQHDRPPRQPPTTSPATTTLIGSPGGNRGRRRRPGRCVARVDRWSTTPPPDAVARAGRGAVFGGRTRRPTRSRGRCLGSAPPPMLPPVVVSADHCCAAACLRRRVRPAGTVLQAMTPGSPSFTEPTMKQSEASADRSLADGLDAAIPVLVPDELYPDYLRTADIAESRRSPCPG